MPYRGWPERALRHDGDAPVVVAVAGVGVVQVSVHEIIDVIAVRNSFVAAGLAVDVVGGVLTAVVLRRTRLGIGGADRHAVVVYVVVVDVMQVAVVQVIRVVSVSHPAMAAPRSVLVAVSFVHPAVVLPHRRLPLSSGGGEAPCPESACGHGLRTSRLGVCPPPPFRCPHRGSREETRLAMKSLSQSGGLCM